MLSSIPRWLIAASVLVLGSLAATAQAQATYYTNTDNENNAHTHVADGDTDILVGRADGVHPIEFNINAAALPTNSSNLTIRAFDVDEEAGETDDVYINGHYLGRLTGANNTWSVSAFAVNPAWLVLGDNLVEIQVDSSGDPTAWVVNVDWAQQLNDGGGATNGDTSGVSITGFDPGTNITIHTQTTVHAITGGTYRLQISLINPNGDAVTVLTEDFAVASNTDSVRNVDATYPMSSVTGWYTIQAQLFWLDPGAGDFPVQQDIATERFYHEAGTTPDSSDVDNDGDGLTNGQEATLGTDPDVADSDGDGTPDGTEVGPNAATPVNSDGDGFIDALDSSIVDSDGDGVMNQSDPANTNPCIPNANHAVCLAADSDSDGLTNAQEDTLGTSRNNADTDGDGAADGAEVGNVSSPTDSDNDGTPNVLESQVTDTDGDGVVNQSDPANTNPCVPNAMSAACLATDSDGDGLTNGQEDTLGTSRGDPDSDGDGANDGAEVGNVSSPTDSDGDGIPNLLESSATDTDGDGIANQSDPANGNACIPNAVSAVCLATDSDGDGLSNGQEDTLGTGRGNSDTDGDGVADGAEVGNVSSPADTDGDGIPNVLESSALDSDNDGVSNQADSGNDNPCVPSSSSAACLAADSDGDGLSNGQEDTLGTDRNNPDSDGDGVNDGVEVGSNPSAPTDTDHDGIPDVFESGDNDGDGTPDAADADSDNDGIPDGVEVGTPGNPRDTDGDGTADYLDADTDGDSLPDALEMGGSASDPIDSDGDGTPDYRDLDSDNDSLPDALEGNASGVDSDGDGIDDAFDADQLGVGDVNGDGIADTGVLRDTDGDGLADSQDVDTDNDGILDSFEGTPASLTDTDGDGVPDVRDLDSDNDYRSDVVEAGLLDVNGDSLMDAGQTRTANPRDTDSDGTPDFRDLDSNNDGAFDVSTGGGALDANHDGRIDAGIDSDEDGIRDTVDAAPQVFGTFSDGDADGVADPLDLDLDNDGVPNSADGSDDTDGDGHPNLADRDADGDGVSDLVEAGGTDVNGDGLADSFVDTNGNGLSDQFETSLGGHALPLPDTDGDGVDNHRDLDSDGDGLTDLIESGGADANNDGRADGADANSDGMANLLQGGGTGGHSLPRPDSDGDGIVDSLDTDSDNDGVSDEREGRGDSDGDGVPNALDSPGSLETAVRGTGALDPITLSVLLAVLALAIWRRASVRGTALVRVAPLALVACVALAPRPSEAADTVKEGMYVGVDFGLSMLEPRNANGGYVIDDERSTGFRVTLGYAWSEHWSAEGFFADGGQAGVSSDNPAVGHLGDIDYRMVGVGAEWLPFGKGRAAKFFPLLKFGVVQITNSTDSDQIIYEKLNDAGLYVGGGAGMRFGKSWLAQTEVVSYDADALFFTIGLRKHF